MSFTCYRCKSDPCVCEDSTAILHGDNVAVMCEMQPDTIDLVVTSPPYDSLRTYSAGKPMSDLWDFDAVAEQLWRIVKPGGVVVWIVADATIDGSETGTSFRQALRFKEIGFRLHDTMIYEKRQISFPDAVRYYDCWEFMFVFSKGAPVSFNPITKPNPNAGKRLRPLKRGKDGVLVRDSGYINNKVAPATSVLRNKWEYTTGSNTGKDGKAHPAAFPEALARDHIRSWSNEGDLVLDPFAGSFTTGKMARELGRKSIGIEVNEEYCQIGVNRLRQKVLF